MQNYIILITETKFTPTKWYNEDGLVRRQLNGRSNQRIPEGEKSGKERNMSKDKTIGDKWQRTLIKKKIHHVNSKEKEVVPEGQLGEPGRET